MFRNRRLTDRRRGFTLMEVLLVLLLLAFLGSMAVLAIGGVRDKANRDSVRSQFATLKQAIDYFNLNANRYPQSLDELAMPTPMPNGQAEKPALTKPVPLDPWGNAYMYQTPGRDGSDYEIWSLGKDGQEISTSQQ